MKPVTQTVLGPPRGNCFAACVASVLELSIDEMPNYHGRTWWNRWLKWMAERGLWLLYSEPAEPFPGFWIAGGPSPRNADVDHAVVMHHGRLVHDPHPNAAGFDVSRINDSMIIVPLDPIRGPVLDGGER